MVAPLPVGLYLRHSTDKQTNARQKHALDAYLSAGARAFENPATSSRVHPLHRPGFRDLLYEAAVGDTVRIADAAAAVRSVKDVLDVRAVLRRRGVHLRVAAGAWSGMDLTADDPMTKLFVTMLAGVLEFQRERPEPEPLADPVRPPAPTRPTPPSPISHDR